MAKAPSPLSSSATFLKVLHLVGARSDQGGILSVLRALQSSATPVERPELPKAQSSVWVHDSFVERRPPPLDLRRNSAALDEHNSHLRLLVAAVRSWPGLQRLLRKEAFDVVHAHSRGAFLLAAWLARRNAREPRRPVVVFTNHTYARRTGMYYRAATRWRLPTVLLTPNMARHYGLSDAPNVEIISACASDRFFDGPTSPPPPSPTGTIRFVGVGNLVHWKKWHLLLAAWAKLPNELKTAGQFELWGPTLDDAEGQRYAAELRSQCEQLRLTQSVKFCGPTNSVDSVISRAHWFVLPSTNEPCSVALIEALALGRPALVSASGGNVDIVQGGMNGRHFVPDDAVDLTRHLAAILHGETVSASPVEIRASVKHRAARTVAEQYTALYQRLLLVTH